MMCASVSSMAEMLVVAGRAPALAPHVGCAHGEYSEYPASTLVPRPDY